MAKHYVFYRQDIINLLLNYKKHLTQKVHEMIKDGIDITKLTYSDTNKMTEQFFDEKVERQEVKLETILDEVDKVVKKTHNMTTLELAKKKKQDLH